MIPLKQFIAEQAEKHGLTWNGFYYRLKRSNFAGLTLIKKNKRVIFVKI
jgi:hypothetical protein